MLRPKDSMDFTLEIMCKLKEPLKSVSSQCPVDELNTCADLSFAQQSS